MAKVVDNISRKNGEMFIRAIESGADRVGADKQLVGLTYTQTQAQVRRYCAWAFIDVRTNYKTDDLRSDPDAPWSFRRDQRQRRILQQGV